MKKLVLFMALCLCLPVLALAVTEGVVEEAAAVDVSVALGAQEESYLPDPSYYAGYGDYEPRELSDTTQWDRAKGELARFGDLHIGHLDL